MKHDCRGAPSLTNYGRGCRCSECRLKKSVYEGERRREKRMKKPVDDSIVKKKPGGRRDNPFVMDDAFTREQILEARKARK